MIPVLIDIRFQTRVMGGRRDTLETRRKVRPVGLRLSHSFKARICVVVFGFNWEIEVAIPDECSGSAWVDSECTCVQGQALPDKIVK